jgi:hypothetical protein
VGFRAERSADGDFERPPLLVETGSHPQAKCRNPRRLPFDDDLAVNVVVTDAKTFHLNLVVSAFPGEIQQRGVSFRKIDA